MNSIESPQAGGSHARFCPVAGQVKTANTQAIAGVAVGMVVGSTTQEAAANGLQASQQAQGSIQQQYDLAYGNCMYAKGDIVPGMAPPAPPPTVAEEHTVVRDPLVAQVQTALIQIGYLHGGADGVMGKKTAAAIRQFETDKGMTVDGAASHNLLAALKAAEAGGTAQAASTVPSGSKWDMPPAATPAAN